jgi:hypothetical protein
MDRRQKRIHLLTRENNALHVGGSASPEDDDKAIRQRRKLDRDR